MRSINKVIIIGNLTRDPEVRETSSGQTVVTFGIATNRTWVTKDGRKQSSTEYHDLVAWAKLGEICQKTLRKGKLVYVEGYLKTRSWETPDGAKKFRTEIVIQDMIILEKRSDKDYLISHESEDTSSEMEDASEKNEEVSQEETTPTEAKEPTPKQPSEPKEEPASPDPKSVDIDSDLGL